MPEIKTLTVLGTGVLGSQIAYQAAFHGFAVTAYDLDDEALDKARSRFTQLAGSNSRKDLARLVGMLEATVGSYKVEQRAKDKRTAQRDVAVETAAASKPAVDEDDGMPF